MKIQYKLFTAFVITFFIVGVGSLITLQTSQNSLRRAIVHNQVIHTLQIMEDIDREMYNRIEEIRAYGRDVLLRETLREDNLAMEAMPEREAWIAQKDREWIAFPEGKLSPFMLAKTTSPLAIELKEKKEFNTKEWLKKPVYPEIFVSDKFGGIVASTNRTSDYMQADEEWYQKAVQQKVWVGELEYDESADSFACAVAVKLFDEHNEFAGVIKAVLNIETIHFLLENSVQRFSGDSRYGYSDHAQVKLLSSNYRLIYENEPEYELDEDFSGKEFIPKIMQGGNVGSFRMTGDLPGEGDELFAYARSQGYRDYPGLGWTTLIEHDAGQLFLLATNLKRNLLLVIGLVSIVALLLTIYFSRLFADLVGRKNQAHFELNQIFQIAADGIRIVDRDFNLVRVNDTFLKMAKLEKTSWQGKKCYEVFHGPHCNTPECTLTRILDGEENIVLEIEKECHDGTKRDCVVTVKPYFDSAGKLIGMIEDYRDVGERKRMENEKEQMQSFLYQQEKLASVGQLAAGVAHEINNPIGFINSNLGSLGSYTAKLVEYIDAASSGLGAEELQQLRKKLKIDFVARDITDLIHESKEGAQRVREIVQNLKNFSRLEDVDRKEADINVCLENTIKVIWNELKYKAKLIKEFGELSPISCFPQQLNQVFMNFLVNAVQAIEKEGVITIKTWQDGANIMVAISDTGSGIAEEDIAKLFEPFFTTKEVGKGTGLGLSIAHDIIKKHNGEIRVESKVGKGTTFTVVLPVEGR
ncbi:MAG: PAS domain-containing protein [Desulfobulbaceae bacterium]|nr:PAS domain-containing protein [Desulfobulbaceae bacterium]